MLFVTLRDLRYRAKRVVVVTVGTTLVFTLVLLMSGLSARFALEPQQTIAAMGAQAWILPTGSTSGFTPVTPFDAAVARGVAGSERVDPIITSRYGLIVDQEVLDVMVVGFVQGGLGAPVPSAGRLPMSSGELVIDESGGLPLDGSVTIGTSSFTVVGLTDERTIFAGLPLVFMRLDDVQTEFYGGADTATALLASSEPTSVPPGFDALSPEVIREDAARPLEKAASSVNLVTFLLWVVAALILGGVVLLSAMERRRDFAVMKAVGARTGWLLGSLIVQAVLITLLASALAATVQSLVAPSFPMKVHVTLSALIRLPVTGVIVAVLAGIGGMRQVARTDPAVAFAGPGA